MKEFDFLNIISSTLNFSNYLGDDCAYLEDLGVFVTHDTLVENVHFSLNYTSPYLLGRKAVSVNLSDLASCIAVPKYITVSLSMPKNVSSTFVSELYRGINDVCNEFNVKVIGGDITGSDKIVISICAIGKKQSEYFASRENAKKDDYIIVTGNFGSSSLGLYSLENFLYAEDDLVFSHINPIPKVNLANKLSKLINSNIAMIDSSDGLLDSLFRIAKMSKHSLVIDFDKIPVLDVSKSFSKRNNLDLSDFVKWGGEDFELVACVSEEIYQKLDSNDFHLIGKVLNKDSSPCVQINYGNITEKITESILLSKSYDHFGGN